MTSPTKSFGSKNIKAANPITRRLIAGLVFGFIVYLALVLLSDVRQVSLYVLNFPWSLFPLVLSLTLFNYTLRFVKWHYYLGQIDIHDLPWIESARLFVAGFPLAVTPGKIGEALKGVWLHQQCKTTTAKGIAVVLAERISDGLALLLLSTFGVIAYPDYWPVFAFVFLLLVGIVVVSQIRPLAYTLLDFGERLPYGDRIAPSLRDFYEGSFAVFRPRATLLAVSLGTISWMGEGIGFYIILLGLGVPSGWHTLSVAIFSLAFSTVIGAVSTLPGGLGAAEASITGMLILLLGMDPGAAAAATLLIRFATLWFGVALGLITWSFSPQLFRLTSDQTSISPTQS